MKHIKNYIKGCKSSFKSLPNPAWYIAKQQEKPPKTVKSRIASVANGIRMYTETWNASLNRNSEENDHIYRSAKKFKSHKKILKNQYVTKYEENFKQNINAIKNITVDGSKEIRGMIPAKETVENSVSDWIQVFSLSSTEFLNGFHDGKKEIESSENDENINWFNPIFDNMKEYTSEIQHDLQDRNFNRGAFIKKYGKNFKNNVATMKEFAEGGLRKGENGILKNETMQNIMNNEMLQTYSREAVNSKHFDKYSKKIINNISAIKELSGEKIFGGDDAGIGEDLNKNIANLKKIDEDENTHTVIRGGQGAKGN
jgi:hypothetical protein